MSLKEWELHLEPSQFRRSFKYELRGVLIVITLIICLYIVGLNIPHDDDRSWSEWMMWALFATVGGTIFLLTKSYNRYKEKETPKWMKVDKLLQKTYHAKAPKFAIQLFDQAIAIDPLYAWTYVLRAIKFHNMHEHEKATADFDKVVRLCPLQSKAYILRGEAFHDRRQYWKAIFNLTIAVMLRDQWGSCRWSSTFNDLRESRIMKRKYQELFKRILSIDPEDVRAYLSNMKTAREVNEQTKIIDDCTCRIKNPKYANSAYPFRERARAYLELGEYKKAIDDYTVALSLEPKELYLYKSRADAYRALNRNEEADRDEEMAHNLTVADQLETVDYHTTWLNYAPHQEVFTNEGIVTAGSRRDWNFESRGDAYMKLGRAAEARKDYLQAIDILRGGIAEYPEWVESYIYLGDIYRKMENNQEAVKNYTQAISTGADNATILEKRADTYSDMQMYQEAIDDYTAAIKLGLQSCESRGINYLKLGDYENAVLDFTASLGEGLEVNDKRWYKYCGDAHLEQGQYLKSIEDYCRAIILSEHGLRGMVEPSWLEEVYSRLTKACQLHKGTSPYQLHNIRTEAAPDADKTL